ncbi:hypothetical protein JCM3774_006712 [Rhodotorula dairenensis]
MTSDGTVELPDPVLGATYSTVLAVKVAVFAYFLREKVEPTIASSEASHALIRLQDLEGDLYVTDVDSSHSCPAAERHARTASDAAVGPLYTRRKLDALVRKLQAQQQRRLERADGTDDFSSRSEVSETPLPAPEVRSNGRPIRASAQDTRYVFAPSLRPQTSPGVPANAGPSSSSPKRHSNGGAPGPKEAKAKRRRTLLPVPASATPASAGPSSSLWRSTLDALPPLVPPAPAAALGSTSTSSADAIVEAASRAGLEVSSSRSTARVLLQQPQSDAGAPMLASVTLRQPPDPANSNAPIRAFLAATGLDPVQRDVLAAALTSAGFGSIGDFASLLFLERGNVRVVGAQLRQPAESWPASLRFRTMGEALEIIVSEFWAGAGIGKRV